MEQSKYTSTFSAQWMWSTSLIFCLASMFWENCPSSTLCYSGRDRSWGWHVGYRHLTQAKPINIFFWKFNSLGELDHLMAGDKAAILELLLVRYLGWCCLLSFWWLQCSFLPSQCWPTPEYFQQGVFIFS